MQLIVLGMHRSGTSVLARILNLMGAYFGPEGIGTGANQENPKGFWERRDVRALNDAVLHGVGCDWNRVLALDASDLPQDLISEFDAKASRLLLEMDAHRPWLLKEPRLCLLFPLWRKWLEVPICIHILRHPVEVASSLRTRNQIPIEAGLELWRRYVRSAFKASEGLPALTLFHRDLVLDPCAFAQNLFAKLSAFDVAGLRPARDEEVRAFVRSELYREREVRKDLQGYLDRPEVTAYIHMLEKGRWPEGWCENGHGNEDALVAYEASVPRRASEDPKLPEFESFKQKLEQAQQALEQRTKEHQQALQKERSAVEELKGSLREARSEVDKARLSLTESQKRAEEALRSLERQRAAHADLQTRFQSMSEAVKLKEADLRLAAQKEEDLRRAIAERADELRIAGTKIGSLETENAGLLEISRQAEESRRLALREADLARRDVARLTRRLVVVEQDNSTLSLRVTELVKALQDQQNQARRAAKALRGELAEAAEMGELHRNELERIRSHWTWRMGAPVRATTRIARKLFSRAPLSDAELIRSSGLFDKNWYLSRYPDVAENGADPVEHFLAYGGSEGRDPGPSFSTSRYLAANSDVKEVGMNALVHYLRHGRSEKRRLV